MHIEDSLWFEDGRNRSLPPVVKYPEPTDIAITE